MDECRTDLEYTRAGDDRMRSDATGALTARLDRIHGQKAIVDGRNRSGTCTYSYLPISDPLEPKIAFAVRMRSDATDTWRARMKL